MVVADMFVVVQLVQVYAGAGVTAQTVLKRRRDVAARNRLCKKTNIVNKIF